MADRLRTPQHRSYDAVVVGSGTGGLVTAALLARSGRRVLVVDHHVVAGGNATVFRRKGYEFDVGVHYLGDCGDDGYIPRVLRAAGARDVGFRPLDPSGFDTLVFPDFEFRIPSSIAGYERRMHEQFPDEGRAIRRWVQLIREIQRFQEAERRPASALWQRLRCGLLFRSIHQTLRQFWARYSDDPRLLAVWAGQSANYCLPPSQASVLTAAGVCEHYLRGAYTLDGGGQASSDALVAAIEAAGGSLLLGTRVQRILVGDGRVTGVEITNRHLGTATVETPTVISNADFKQTMLGLVGREHLRPRTVRRVEAAQMAPALGVVFLGIRRDLAAEGHRRTNYWIYPSYDQEPDYAAVARGAFPETPFVYASIASLKNPTHRRLAPDGLVNLQLMAPAPATAEAWGVHAAAAADGSYREDAGYRAQKAAFAARLLATAARALPGIEDQVEFLEVSTPLTHHRYTLATGGTGYGLAATPRQFRFLRPGPRTEIRGLFLCGASTESGHGIVGAMRSGVLAATRIAGRHIQREVTALRGKSAT